MILTVHAPGITSNRPNNQTRPASPVSLRHASPRLTSPHLATPRLATTRLTSPFPVTPRLTAPHRASPRLTAPHRASPRPASPHLSQPHLASPCPACSRHASPRLASPHPALSRLASPRPTPPLTYSVPLCPTSALAASPAPSRSTSIRLAPFRITSRRGVILHVPPSRPLSAQETAT